MSDHGSGQTGLHGDIQRSGRTDFPSFEGGVTHGPARVADPVGPTGRSQGGRLMVYWLFKSEPSVWSWEDQVAKGETGEEWDGVRNYQARNNMRAMRLGDRGFFYHSQSEKAVVGIVEICAEAHPDTTTDDDRWECVDIKAVTALPVPVTLDICRKEPRLAEMALIRNSRLSVQPVTDAEWAVICELGGLVVDR